MKITKKFVEKTAAEACGEDVVPLVRFLYGKGKVSEFELVDSLKEDVQSLRNKLYLLQKVSLVDSSRKKDKKKGWYIYYWTFKPQNIIWLYKKIREEKIERLEARLAREKENQFYSCKNNCMRLNFDQAVNFNFKCPECGELMNLTDNTETIKKIEEEIKKLRKEIEDIEEESKPSSS